MPRARAWLVALFRISPSVFNDPCVQICELEYKMNEIILKINQKYSIFESHKLHSELRILDWILYQICINEK